MIRGRCLLEFGGTDPTIDETLCRCMIDLNLG